MKTPHATTPEGSMKEIRKFADKTHVTHKLQFYGYEKIFSTSYYSKCSSNIALKNDNIISL